MAEKSHPSSNVGSTRIESATRARRASHGAASGPPHLTQLAAIINQSPRVQAQKDLAEKAGNSNVARGLCDLAVQFNQEQTHPVDARSMDGQSSAQLRRKGDENINDISSIASSSPGSPRFSIDSTSPPPFPAEGQDTIQRERISVGYDRVGSGNAGDVLVTDGLANCIAVAVQDTNTKAAVMGHLNTGTIDYRDVGHYRAFRALLLDELRRVAGRDPVPQFHVCMGALWVSGDRDLDDPANNEWWLMRYTILNNCKQAFGTEPTKAGPTAEFDTATSTLKGSLTQEGVGAPPDNWERQGDAIPYDDLKGEDQSKWKLAKNRGPCFLTTVCVEVMGLADNCDELTTLRGFRDGYMATQTDGPSLIAEYYRIAPNIVAAIKRSPQFGKLARTLYIELVLGSITLIRAGRLREALEHYRFHVLELQKSLQMTAT